MSERYLGSTEDVSYIQAYLDAIRAVDPIEIATVENIHRLESLDRFLDPQLFESLSSILLQALAEEAKSWTWPLPIPRDRYFFGIPEDDSLGGFHDIHSVGYNYWLEAGFAMLLNYRMVSSLQVRTLEALRNYLHDCMHHVTFRTFRRSRRFPAATREVAKNRVPEIYREQYGINFRNKDGDSYSSPGLTEFSPQAINLNLLMDGTIVLTVARFMRELIAVSDLSVKTEIEQFVLNELFLEDPEALDRYHPLSRRYIQDVVIPTHRFIVHWGGETFRARIVRAMYSGNLGPIKRSFNRRYGEKDAWEKVFKAPTFKL